MYESPAEFVRNNWKEFLVDKKYLIYAALVLLGVWLAPKVAPQIRKVPVVGPIVAGA
jgi:hypothetical protein